MDEVPCLPSVLEHPRWVAVVERLAQALLSGETAPAREAFPALRERAPQEASQAAGLVRAHAPDLEELLVSPLPRAPGAPSPTALTVVLRNASRSLLGRGVTSGVLILLVFLLRALLHLPGRQHRGPERQWVEARRQATRLCSQLELQDKERLCATLQQMVAWGTEGECSQVLGAQAEVERQLEAEVAALGAGGGLEKEAQRQRLKAAREEFRRALLNGCPE